MTRLILIILLAAIIQACQSPSKENNVGENAIEYVAPEEVGMISDSLQLIKKHIQWAIDSQFIEGGVALVARNGKIVFHEAVGYSNREKTEPLKKDDIFRMASMTKPITTTAVMQLYEQGKLNIDDPISKYIPEFAHPNVILEINKEDSSYTSRPAAREITLHHLLTHTSGIPYGVFDPVAGPVYAKFDVTEGWTKDSVVLENNIREMAERPLMHDPGVKFTYGTSIDVLGRVVEIVSGMPLDEYFRKNIFEPLNMKDTYFYLPESKSNRLVDVWFTSDIDSATMVGLGPDYPIAGAKTYFAGGAGLSSTTLDYFRFAQSLLNDGIFDGSRILQEKTVELMTRNHIDTLYVHENEQFGYGFSVYTSNGNFGRRVGRYSWGGYWQTIFWVDPERDIVAMLFTNAQHTPGWNQLLDGFEGIVNNAVID